MKRFVFFLSFVLFSTVAFAQNTDSPASQAGKNFGLPARKRVISVEFAAPLLRHFTIGQELELGRRISWETKVGVIFSGTASVIGDFNHRQQGGFVRTGFRFYRDFPQNGWYRRDRDRDHNAFEGRYIKPELILGYFTENNSNNLLQRNEVFSSAILINFGRQYVFARRFAVGYEWGLGYAFSQENTNRDRYGWYHSHLGAPNSDFPIAFSVGFNVGIVLGRYTD